MNQPFTYSLEGNRAFSQPVSWQELVDLRIRGVIKDDTTVQIEGVNREGAHFHYGQLAGQSPYARGIQIADPEYSSLRSEIGQYSTQIASMMFWTNTVTVSYLAMVSRWDAQFAFVFALLPLLFIIPCNIHHNSTRRNILRIASYLRAFGGNKYQYETQLIHHRHTLQIMTLGSTPLQFTATLTPRAPSSEAERQAIPFWFDYARAIPLAFCASVFLCILTSLILFWPNTAVIWGWFANLLNWLADMWNWFAKSWSIKYEQKELLDNYILIESIRIVFVTGLTLWGRAILFL